MFPMLDVFTRHWLAGTLVQERPSPKPYTSCNPVHYIRNLFQGPHGKTPARSYEGLGL